MKLVNLKNIPTDVPFKFKSKSPQLEALAETYQSLSELEKALKGVEWVDDQNLQKSYPGYTIDFTKIYTIGSGYYASLSFRIGSNMYSTPVASIKPK